MYLPFRVFLFPIYYRISFWILLPPLFLIKRKPIYLMGRIMCTFLSAFPATAFFDGVFILFPVLSFIVNVTNL